MLRRFFTQNTKRFLIISLVVQGACMLVFLSSYIGLREVSCKNIRQFADHFVENAMQEMNRNSGYLGDSTVNSPDYRVLFKSEGLEKIKIIGELQKTYKMLSDGAENNYNFFAYDMEKEDFLELTYVKMNFDNYRRIRKDLIGFINSRPKSARWCLAEAGGQRIVVQVWIYGDFVQGAWIDEASFLSYLGGLDCGTKGGVSLISKEEKIEKRPLEQWLGSSTLFYDLGESNTDFGIGIVVQGNKQMQRIMIMQVISFLLALIVMQFLVLLSIQLRKNLLVPVKNMTDILEKYQLGQGKNAYVREKQAVVEDAYQILDRLGETVVNLNTELYQSELEKKQLQLNFRNVQIRPHFYINCLAMISSMAQLNAVDKIQEMTVCLSEYYRYVLCDCMDMVSLQQEVHHMENVMRIHSELSSNQLVFQKEISADAAEIRIPILTVNTFLENSIKHCTGRDGIVKMKLTAERIVWQDAVYLDVKISDNGGGIPPEMMAKLNRGEMPEQKDGKHIGISNVLQRLKLIYNGKAGYVFSGDSKTGACVEIWIPVEEEYEAADCG